MLDLTVFFFNERSVPFFTHYNEIRRDESMK